MRPFVTGELAGPWPEASGLLPERFAREPDRANVLELTHALAAGSTRGPDAAAELADAITALRLAVGGPVATGPVYFERIDRHPVGVRPSLPIAAAQPPGEPTRLDVFRGGLARRLRERVAAADEDAQLGEALDRWELSLFQDEPFRSEQLRTSLESLLGAGNGLWAAALRAAVLLGESGRERAEQHARLKPLVDGGEGPRRRRRPRGAGRDAALRWPASTWWRRSTSRCSAHARARGVACSRWPPSRPR